MSEDKNYVLSLGYGCATNEVVTQIFSALWILLETKPSAGPDCKSNQSWNYFYAMKTSYGWNKEWCMYGKNTSVVRFGDQ
jgi:hypothetical protein